MIKRRTFRLGRADVAYLAGEENPQRIYVAPDGFDLENAKSIPWPKGRSLPTARVSVVLEWDEPEVKPVTHNRGVQRRKWK